MSLKRGYMIDQLQTVLLAVGFVNYLLNIGLSFTERRI
jgi:hypothetical protein